MGGDFSPPLLELKGSEAMGLPAVLILLLFRLKRPMLKRGGDGEGQLSQRSREFHRTVGSLFGMEVAELQDAGVQPPEKGIRSPCPACRVELGALCKPTISVLPP